jgi:DNA-directed RNA polymerase specialized sigma24 family protein
LEIGPRVEAVLDEEGLLLALPRVQLRCLAGAAYAACASGPPQELGPWLRERIDEAVAALLAEDREAERSADPLPASSTTFLSLTAAFGVEPGLARRASVAFHELPRAQRRLLRGIVQDGRTLAELAAATGRPAGDLKLELRAAVESLERAIGTRLSERLGGDDRG